MVFAKDYNSNKTFRQNVASKFTSKIVVNKSNANKPNKRVKSSSEKKQVEVARTPSLVPPGPSEEILEKLKFYKKKGNNSKENTNPKDRWSYTQAFTPKIDEILKLKENFPNLLAKKIERIHKTINDSGKIKSRINITTKKPSRRQIIILMSNNNKLKFMTLFNVHIANLNRVLKNIKSDIIANFI